MGNETGKGKNPMKAIIINRSFIWVTGIQLPIGNLQRVHVGLSSFRAQDTKKPLSSIVLHWLRVTSRELIPQHSWPSPHNGPELALWPEKALWQGRGCANGFWVKHPLFYVTWPLSSKSNVEKLDVFPLKTRKKEKMSTITSPIQLILGVLDNAVR